MLAYDYSGKILISLDDRKIKRNEEINRVKNLKGGAPWVISNREEGQLFLDDKVGEVNGIGDSVTSRLQTVGITTIADLKNMTEQKVRDIAGKKLGRGMSLQMLKQYQAVASTSEISAPPDLVTNYRKEENPYLARFGDQSWEKEIDKSITLRSSLCITEYITHMWKHTALAMQGTIHQDDWLVYHDALALMTARSTVKWMTDTTGPDGKKYIERWILPELGCNDDIPRFGGRPVGDLPEGMPLDCSLNNDLKVSTKIHVVDTLALQEVDHRKFSLSTPKRCSEAIRRIWDFGLTGKTGEDPHEGGVPCGQRIVDDCNRVVNSYIRIDREARGMFVDGLGNSSGKRGEQRRATGVKAARGGKRIKMTPEEQIDKLEKWRHPDLSGVKAQAIQESKDRHNSGSDV
jgi:predicted flap endonuclease-1-like 5' DNA nuclease